MEDQIPYAGEMLGATLFLVGLVVSWVLWRRRGAAYGLRGIAWSLLLLAAGLVGLIDTLWGFVAQLLGSILSPVLWAGVAVGGLAVVFYIVSGVMKARGVGTKGRAKRSAKDPEGGSPSKVSEGGPGQVTSGPAAKSSSGGEDDFSDIEAILRERGIS